MLDEVDANAPSSWWNKDEDSCLIKLARAISRQDTFPLMLLPSFDSLNHQQAGPIRAYAPSPLPRPKPRSNACAWRSLSWDRSRRNSDQRHIHPRSPTHLPQNYPYQEWLLKHLRHPWPPWPPWLAWPPDIPLYLWISVILHLRAERGNETLLQSWINE